MKTNKQIILLIIFLLINQLSISILSANQNEIDIYENINIESVSAFSSSTGNTIFDFIPMDFKDLKKLNKVFVSNSMYVANGDFKYINDKTVMENIDFIKSFLLIWNHRRDFMPFISYYTPFKVKLDADLQREITKKQDVLSAGLISSIGRNQVMFSLDVNYSTYTENDGSFESEKNVIGISNKVLLNFNLDKNSSVFISAASPVYLESIVNNDFNDGDNERKYFNKLVVNGGLNYTILRDWFAAYSGTYREFEKIYSTDNEQINYRWAIEHKVIFGRMFDENVRVSLDYKLTPSVFDIPFRLTGYKHSLGFLLGYKYDNLVWNFYINDSTFLSDEPLSRIVFKMDLGYSF